MNTAIITNDSDPLLPLQQVTATFFSKNSPDRTKYLFWKLLQCYVLKDCITKVEMPEEEVAQFYDQLMDLVSAAYIIHQAKRPSPGKEGGQNV